MSAPAFETSDGALRVYADGPSWRVVGALKGVPARTAIVVAPDRCVLMLDAEACGAEAHENVRCIDRAAHTLWRLSLDPSRDCAVALGAHPTDAGRLEIGTFGGWSLDVAITTGEILGRTFVK